jgi:hypothetical protein
MSQWVVMIGDAGRHSHTVPYTDTPVSGQETHAQYNGQERYTG